MQQEIHEIIKHPNEALNLPNRFTTWLGGAFGSMHMFWVLVLWQLIWITLATVGFSLFKNDKYPFAFLLFLSNLIQLWALPLLGSLSNQEDKKRDAKNNADYKTQLHIAQELADIKQLLESK